MRTFVAVALFLTPVTAFADECNYLFPALKSLGAVIHHRSDDTFTATLGEV